MTTGAHSGFVDLEAKYLGQDETMLRLLIMPGAVALRLPKVEELRKEWEDPEIPLGKLLQIRVRQSYAQINQIVEGMGSRPALGTGGTGTSPLLS